MYLTFSCGGGDPTTSEVQSLITENIYHLLNTKIKAAAPKH